MLNVEIEFHISLTILYVGYILFTVLDQMDYLVWGSCLPECGWLVCDEPRQLWWPGSHLSSPLPPPVSSSWQQCLERGECSTWVVFLHQAWWECQSRSPLLAPPSIQQTFKVYYEYSVLSYLSKNYHLTLKASALFCL